MKKTFLFSGIFIIMISSLTYSSYCPEPSKPLSGLPALPSCADPLGGIGDCGRQEIEDYKTKIENYVSVMQTYADDALNYANCEQQAAIDAWNKFLGDLEEI